MGCTPSNNKKEEIIACPPQQQQEEKVMNKDDFKIREGLMVQETKGDPSLLYDEISVLGEGAFGKVVKIRHKISKVLRAMKIIQKDKLDMKSDDEKALINEMNVVKTLDHPNIMKVYEYFNTPKCLYIISELFTGGELFDKIKANQYLSEKVSVYLMKQLLSAVDFCHQNNIIHRDLKPENILIESEEEARKEFFTIKVIDFGTSDKLKKDQKFEEQIGTPLYIAPEVLSGSYNEKCDLWSCGVIMYIMLCGVPPFQGENDDEIYQKIKKNDVKFEEEIWDRISDKAKDLIKRFLTKNIKKRISAKEALEHPWIKDMKKINKISKEDLNEVVNNLRKYSATKKLQQSTLAYIVHNLTKKEDTDVLRSIFIEFDENGDGRLSKDELIQGLNLVLSPEESEKEVNRIMNIIDVDGNGFIEYEEFLRATLDKKKILTDENLRTAFRLYDIKNRNRINAKELGIVLGGGNTDVDENVWKELIDEADLNKDGEIDFEDFSKLMEEC